MTSGFASGARDTAKLIHRFDVRGEEVIQFLQFLPDLSLRAIFSSGTREQVWQASIALQLAAGQSNDQHPAGTHASPPPTIQNGWVVWKAQKLIWLPQAYRPGCVVPFRSIIVVGCLSGDVVLVKLSSTLSDRLNIGATAGTESLYHTSECTKSICSK